MVPAVADSQVIAPPSSVCVSIIQIYRNLRKPLPELKRVPRKKTT